MDRAQVIEQIGHFLRNELSVQESTKVKDLITTDKIYREVYEELKGIQLGLKVEDLEGMLDLMKKVENDIGSGPPETRDEVYTKPSHRSKMLMYLVGLLIGLGLMYGINKFSDTDNLDIKEVPQMAENIEQYVVHQQERSTSTDLSKAQERAYNLFVIQKYDLAMPLLEDLWERDKDITAYYYLGIAHWYTGEQERAREILSNNLFNDYKKPY